MLLAAAGGDAFRCALLGRVGAHAPQRFDGELLDYVLVDYPGRQVRVPCATCLRGASLTRISAARATRTSFNGCTACMQTISCSRGKRRATTKGCLLPLAPCYANFQVRGSVHRVGACVSLADTLKLPTARDKALPSLFVDAPVLPSSAMAILEWLVCLGRGEDGEAASMEQRTLGLITLRDIVMHRQAERSACLALVLRCTVHEDDALRGKAIRMVVNQLHPLAYAASQVESFAGEHLDSVLQLQSAIDAEAAAAPDTEEALRRISLYFALCTRAETLLPRLFDVYAASGPAAQPAFHRNMVRVLRPATHGTCVDVFRLRCHRLASRAPLGPKRRRFCSLSSHPPAGPRSSRSRCVCSQVAP